MPTYRHVQPVVAPGEYNVTVMAATLRRSKSGNEMMVLRLSANGSKNWFSEHLVFSDRSYWRIAEFLTSMGKQLTGDEDINPADYIGRTGRAIVGVDDFNGRPQNVIKKWLPPKSEADADTSADSGVNEEEVTQ
jgi:hypothetical protein